VIKPALGWLDHLLDDIWRPIVLRKLWSFCTESTRRCQWRVYL